MDVVSRVVDRGKASKMETNEELEEQNSAVADAKIVATESY